MLEIAQKYVRRIAEMPETGGPRGKDDDDTGHDETKPIRPEDKRFIDEIRAYIDMTLGLDFECKGELWYSPLSERRNSRPRYPQRGRDDLFYDLSEQDYSETLSFESREMNVMETPLPPKEIFDCWLCNIQEVKFLLLRQAEKKIRLNDLIQIIYSIELPSHTLCILAKDDLNSEDRKTLIQHRISFVIPGKQLYLLYIGGNLLDTGTPETPGFMSLSPAAQCMLLFHLQIHSLHDMNFSEIAKILHYSPQTISDAAEDLKKHELCDIKQGRDKMKSLHFQYQRLELWDNAYPRLTVPIEKAAWTPSVNSERFQLLTSGDKAMQHYVRGLNIETLEFKLQFEMKMEERKCYAVSKRTEQGKLLSTRSVSIDYPNFDIIEFWKYDPEILARNEFVDPLSLVLCYKHNKDEVLQGQLRRIVETVLRR